MMRQKIYLDNSTTTRPSAHVASRMMPFFTDRFGSPSAPHQMGQEIFPAMEESLKMIYRLIGAREIDDFVFTSSGAEAVNQVVLAGYFDSTLKTGKNHFISSHIDEAPSIMAIGRLEKLGCVGKLAKANKQGQVTAEAIAEVITPRTALVSLSWANGLTGVIHPVLEISKLCQERGILFHLDATHVLGKLFFDLHEIGPKFLTFNGDNLHAPKGTGGLYIEAGTVCSALILGGIEQGGLRAGSFNIPGLIGLGAASEEALDSRDLLCTEIARLRDKFEIGIVSGFPDAFPLYRTQERLPHCTAIAFPGIVNEAMLFSLNRRGVLASIGGGSQQQIGLVLSQAGIEDPLSQTAVSFSLSRDTTEEEIDAAIEIVVETAWQLRRASLKLI